MVLFIATPSNSERERRTSGREKKNLPFRPLGSNTHTRLSSRSTEVTLVQPRAVCVRVCVCVTGRERQGERGREEEEEEGECCAHFLHWRVCFCIRSEPFSPQTSKEMKMGK